MPSWTSIRMRRKACTKPCSGILINMLSKLCSRQNLCFIFLWVKVYIVFECIDTSKVVAVIATLQTKKNGSKTDDQTEKNLGFRRGFKTNWTKLSPIWRPSTDEALRVLDQHEGRPRCLSLQPHSLFHQNQVPHLHLLLRTKWWKMCENSNITRIMFLGSLIFFSRKVNFHTCALLLLSVSANLKCFQLHFAEADNLQVDNKVQDSRWHLLFPGVVLSPRWSIFLRLYLPLYSPLIRTLSIGQSGSLVQFVC